MSDHYKTTLTSNGSSVSATISKGARIAVQPDAPVYVVVGEGSATPTAAEGVYVAANDIYDVPFTDKEDTVAIISVSGTAVAKILTVSP